MRSAGVPQWASEVEEPMALASERFSLPSVEKGKKGGRDRS